MKTMIGLHVSQHVKTYQETLNFIFIYSTSLIPCKDNGDRKHRFVITIVIITIIFIIIVIIIITI